MSPRDREPSAGPTADASEQSREWIQRWAVAGPILDEERWARLKASSSEDLRMQALDLLALWQPDLPGDDGEALILQQRVFTRQRAGG